MNALGTLLVLFVMVVILADVIGRTALRAPLGGTSEIVAMSIAAIVFLQFPSTLRAGRVIRSDGLSVEIASPGADRLGRAGLTGEIDTHFWERFGSAIMLSVIGGAAEYVSALGETATESARSISTVDPITGAVTTITTEPSRTATEARSIAAEKSSAILQDIANEAFKESSKIPPTIYVAQGESIIVYLRRDLDFSDFYADPVRQEIDRKSVV